MRRKIRLEEIKDFKIERKVFDERTLFAIYKLMLKGSIRSVESLIKEGKESVVISGKDRRNKWIAIKVYRTEHCDFRNMWKYLISDPRFFSVKKSRRNVVYNWCKREFKNLKLAFKGKVNCPKPIDFYENVLVMSFIGSRGIPAPRLVDLDFEKFEMDEIRFIHSEVMKEFEKLSKIGLVHSDLSEYNILLYRGKPYLIDFSQAVTKKHPLFHEFLERDRRNINLFFKKFGLE